MVTDLVTDKLFGCSIVKRFGSRPGLKIIICKKETSNPNHADSPFLFFSFVIILYIFTPTPTFHVQLNACA